MSLSFVSSSIKKWSWWKHVLLKEWSFNRLWYVSKKKRSSIPVVCVFYHHWHLFILVSPWMLPALLLLQTNYLNSFDTNLSGYIRAFKVRKIVSLLCYCYIVMLFLYQYAVKKTYIEFTKLSHLWITISKSVYWPLFYTYLCHLSSMKMIYFIYDASIVP